MRDSILVGRFREETLRRSSVLAITAISCVLFAVAAMRLSPRSFPLSRRNRRARNQRLRRRRACSFNLSLQLSLPPSSSFVATQIPAFLRTIVSICNHCGYRDLYGEARRKHSRGCAQYLKKTGYLTSSGLAEAIRKSMRPLRQYSENRRADHDPRNLPAPIIEKTVSVPKDFEVRAIYLTGVMAASDHGMRIIRHWREVGGNAVVFDIKDSDGSVNIPFEHPLLGKHQVYIHDLPKYVHFLHSENMHAIARVAMFRDERMVVEHPELAVQSKKNTPPWRENGKLVWTDSSNPKVQDYNIALAKFVAQSGADEIQFDYVRFPAEGDQKDASFVFQNEACGDGRLGRPADAKRGGTSTNAHLKVQRSDVILTS